MGFHLKFCLAVVLLVCSYAHARCPGSYSSVGGLCLKGFAEDKNWIDAQQVCRSYSNGYLANVLSQRDQAAVTHVYDSIKGKCLNGRVWSAYIGGLAYGGHPYFFNPAPKNSFDPNNYVYSVPNNFAYSNWAKKQPDNYNGHEKCICMGKDETWNDVPCGDAYCFICQADHI